MTKEQLFCSTGCSIEYKNKIRIEEWKYKNKNVKDLKGVLRIFILKEKNNKCEACGFEGYNKKTGNSILQLHHKDANHENNTYKNIKVLCPNCHAMTETFGALNKENKEVKIPRRRYTVGEYKISNCESCNESFINPGTKTICKECEKKQKEENKPKCKVCGKEQVSKKTGMCFECYQKEKYYTTKKMINGKIEKVTLKAKLIDEKLKQELIVLIKEKSKVQIAIDYGVSDNTIRKWLKKLDLPTTAKEIKEFRKQNDA